MSKAIYDEILNAGLEDVYKRQVFAFAMLKGNLSASVEKIGLIVMSVMACFVGGFLCGKKNIKKRYLWGLGVGVLYCLFFGVIRVGMGLSLIHI